MSHHLPALVVVTPLICGLLVFAIGLHFRRLSLPLTFVTLTATLAAAVGLLVQVASGGTAEYRLGGWPAPIGIVYEIDTFSAAVIVLIFFVAIVNLLGQRHVIARQLSDRLSAFCGLYLLFTAGLTGIVATGDAFNLYVLLEISSLTAYALLGFGSGRAALSALKYLFMGTIGASFYLLGIGYLYLVTGTLNMADFAQRLPAVYQSPVVLIAFAMCMAGLFVKMALFPMQGWLSNAYSKAPTASAGLIAPLTTKVMIYAMIRITFSVFRPQFAFGVVHIGNFIVQVATVAIVAGSLLALAQTRLRRMLTYLIIAEVGYMVGGFWLGNGAGVTGAMLHVINDGAMTLCMFLTAGVIAHQIGGDRFAEMQGIFRRMPWTMAVFVVGAMAMIGVPPTCGFFSKWYLISGGLKAGQYGFVVALIFSSLVNAVLFFRIFEIGHFEPVDPNGGHHGPGPVVAAEAPASALAALMLAAAGLVALGLLTGPLVSQLIERAIPAGLLM